jgi:putative membrane protein
MNSRRIRTYALLTTTAFSPFCLLAQSDLMARPASATQANQPNQIPASATSIQDAVPGADTSQTMRDKAFLRKVGQGGLAEVKFGRLASQKGASDDVKNFGQKMVEDHTKLNNEMAPIAKSMGVTPPQTLDKKNQAEYDKLSGLSGDEFDTEYVSLMVKDHHEDLRDFRAEANATSNPVLKTAVENAATVIHEHMVMIDKIAQNKGVAVPGHGNHGRTPTT